jgi:23S rRNA pseudouridine2605 synthase|tara:strand:+ start:3458 stop:4192 length:735 start_codon:yes stop_codon:yes gene_type:complete
MDRIQKVLANSGIASRRKVESLIDQRRVKVDGVVATIGMRISGKEKIFVDSKEVIIDKLDSSHQHIVYYKPAGEVSTRSDPEGRKTIFQNISPPSKGRWVSVGRLDISTSGLMILTTDGKLANQLMHPRYQVIREYAVRIIGELSNKDIVSLKNGIELSDGLAKFQSISKDGKSGINTWYKVTLKEGRNREVKRIFEAINFRVSRLIRIRFGSIKLGSMKRGDVRNLTPKEVGKLHNDSDSQKK